MDMGWEYDRKRAAWWIVGLVLIAAVLYVIYSFVGTFIFAVFIYYATRPIYRRINDHFEHPDAAVSVSLFLITLPALLLVAYAGWVGLQEFGQFARSTNLDQYDRLLGPYLNATAVGNQSGQMLDSLSRNSQRFLQGGLGDQVRTLLQSALSYVTFIATVGLHLFLMFALAFYLLRDDYKIADWASAQFGDDHGVLRSYAATVDNDFHAVFFGNVLNAVFIGLLGAVTYNGLNFITPPTSGVPYPTMLGLLTGVASLIPVVGMKLVYFPVTGYLAVASVTTGRHTLWFTALFFGVSFVIVDTIPDFVVRAYVAGEGSDLHLGMVMFAYIFGSLLFGWYGLFLGPIILVLFVHFVDLVLPELVAHAPIEPESIEPSRLHGDDSSRSTPADAGDDESQRKNGLDETDDASTSN